VAYNGNEYLDILPPVFMFIAKKIIITASTAARYYHLNLTWATPCRAEKSSNTRLSTPIINFIHR